MKKNVQTAGCHGMTLIEVMVTAAITSIVLAGVVTSVLMGNQINHANAQHITAFGLCKEWYEQMRSVPYTNLTASLFPDETVRITHLGGEQKIPLYGIRSCSISETNNPARKQVRIQVQWTYRNQALTEELDGMIYRRR